MEFMEFVFSRSALLVSALSNRLFNAIVMKNKLAQINEKIYLHKFDSYASA